MKRRGPTTVVPLATSTHAPAGTVTVAVGSAVVTGAASMSRPMRMVPCACQESGSSGYDSASGRRIGNPVAVATRASW